MSDLHEVGFVLDGNRCRTQEFLDSLEAECKAKARFLLAQLSKSGVMLAGTSFAKPLSGAGSGLWELRGHCKKRALRFYYWRSGRAEFTVAWGELKEDSTASRSVIAYAVSCHEDWKRRQKQDEEA